MHVAVDRQSTKLIRNPAIRELVAQRIYDFGGEEFDSRLGFFLVIEPGDTIEVIQKQVGFNILQNRYTGIRFEATGFTPSFEFIQEFASCYDMVFILSDDGFGVELLVPKEEGIEQDLLAMCRMYAFKEGTQ